MKKFVAGLCVAGTLLSGAAMAADSGFYAALDVGQSKAKDACTGLPAGFSCKNTGTAVRIGGGYQINNNVGAEVSYGDYGSNNMSGTVLGVPVTGTASSSGFQAAIVGSLPLNDTFALTGKLGVANTKVKSSASGGGFGASVSATSTTGTFGIGMRYNISKSVALRAQYEDLGNVGDAATTGKSKLTLLTLGATFGL